MSRGSRGLALAALLIAACPSRTTGAPMPEPAAVPPPTGVVITEVRLDTTGQGFVELYNSDRSVIELAGMTLCANNICTPMALPSEFGTSLIPQDFVVIAADAGKWRTAHPTFFGTIGQAINATVLNGLKPEGDTLTLHAAGDGHRLDGITWSGAAPAPGQSYQRDLTTGDLFAAAESPGGARPPAPGTATQPQGAPPPAGPPPATTVGATPPGATPTATTAAAPAPPPAPAATATLTATAATAPPPPPPAAAPSALPARPARPASLTPRGLVSIGIEAPAAGSTVSGPVHLTGWAIAASGNPVDRIWVAIDGDARGGGTYVGAATVGLARPDLPATTGDDRLGQAGFDLSFDASRFKGAWHWLVVFAHEAGQPDAAGWDVEAVDLYVAP